MAADLLGDISWNVRESVKRASYWDGKESSPLTAEQNAAYVFPDLAAMTDATRPRNVAIFMSVHREFAAELPLMVSPFITTYKFLQTVKSFYHMPLTSYEIDFVKEGVPDDGWGYRKELLEAADKGEPVQWEMMMGDLMFFEGLEPETRSGKKQHLLFTTSADCKTALPCPIYGLCLGS